MRIRTIKPEFWTSEDIARLSDKAKLLAIGLLNYSDDHGYFNANPNLILAAIFPHEIGTPVHILLDELQKPNALGESFIEVCTGKDGRQIGRVAKFDDHQNVNRAKESKLKPFWVDKLKGSKGSGLFTDDQSSNHGVITDESVMNHGSITSGKEQGTGKGKEQGTGKRKDRDGDFSEVDSVIDHLNEKIGSSYGHSKNSREPISGRMADGHSAEDCKLVIDFKVNDWLGTDQEQYLRPNTLFRPKNFPGYLFAAQRWDKTGRPRKNGKKDFEKGTRQYPRGEKI